MDNDDAVYKLTSLQYSVDQELAHIEADDILCAFLLLLGHGDVVDAYRKIDKWYAR